MDYKEKLKDIINSNKTPFVDIDTFLKYFPELKEENKDEKIKKAIRYAIGQSTHSDGTLINGVSSDSIKSR